MTTKVEQHGAEPRVGGYAEALWLQSGDITIFFATAEAALFVGEQLVGLARRQLKVRETMREPLDTQVELTDASA